MSHPRTRSQGAASFEAQANKRYADERDEIVSIQLRDFIVGRDSQDLGILVHGRRADLADLRSCTDCQYSRQAIDFNDKLCAILALEISLRPICTELGLAVPSKGVLLDAFLTSGDYKPTARKFFNFSTGDKSYGDPRADRRREGFLSINAVRVVLYLISRRYFINFRLGLCQSRGDGLNFEVMIFDPLLDESTAKFSKSRTVWLYRNGLTRDPGLGWEPISPEDSRITSIDSSVGGKFGSEHLSQSFSHSSPGSRKRQRVTEDEPSSKKPRTSLIPEYGLEPVSRFTRSRQRSQSRQYHLRTQASENDVADEETSSPYSPRDSVVATASEDPFLSDDEYAAPNQLPNVDINYIRRSARAHKQPPWDEMGDITIEELLLWFPNHVLNWPGLALLVETKGWDQAHVAKFLYNNLVATMKPEDQYQVKLNTVGSKLARAIKKLPGLGLYSFSTRANYETEADNIWSTHLLLPPEDWKTEPAELWEFFIPPEKKEIRIPAELRDRPFSQRLYNAYCDQKGIARPYDDVPEPPILEPGEPHPLLDSPLLDTDYPIELGIQYIRENPREWYVGTTALPLIIDARIPEGYGRRDIVRDYPHICFGDTFLYIHAEVSHHEIVRIWRYENEGYLKLQWKASSDSELIKKAEAAVRKRKQIAIERIARREEGISHRKTRATNPTIKRIHQAFENYKGECGQKIREVRSRLSRSELDEMYREREARRVHRRRDGPSSKWSRESSMASQNIVRIQARQARPFPAHRDALLASDILYSGPPVRKQASVANMTGSLPYNGLDSNQQHAWQPNTGLISNSPYSYPMGGANDVPTTVQDSVNQWSIPDGLDLYENFNFEDMNFDNLDRGSMSRMFRNSDPELSAIPNSRINSKNENQGAPPPNFAIDPNLIDPALLHETQGNSASGKLDLSMALDPNTNELCLPFSDNVPSFLSRQWRSQAQQQLNNTHHQDQRRSTGNSSSWEKFVAEISSSDSHNMPSAREQIVQANNNARASLTEEQAFEAFVALNMCGEEQMMQKRESSDMWNEFVAMPGLRAMSLD